MEISQEHTDLLVRASKSVGRKFALRFPAMEAEDIASEVTLRALEEWRTFERKLSQAADHGRTEYEVLHLLLSQRASKYCGEQSYAYQMNSATAVYTPKEVRAILRESYYNPDAYATPSKSDQHGVAVDHKDLWVNLADIKAALDRVSDKTHDTILAAFGPEDVGLAEPERWSVDRAVAALTQELNRHLGRAHDNGPGSRRATSNACAQNITYHQENAA
ncbi:hypothetical protein GCM10022419_015780 [Nonomuraea rosea]|uniref:Sigma-70 family RNA polymerase sigma factor n=1 Tax=Nonomuraea rosea TaxID=638574 RepID=A0ABP6VMY0_9ACTN